MPWSTYYLRNLGLLDGLPDAVGRALEQHVRVQAFTRRQVVFAQGAPAEAVYLLAEGMVELVRREGTRETILLVLTPGDFIGEPLEDPSQGHPVQARALEASIVCSIARPELEAILLAHPALAWRLLTWLSRNTSQAYTRIHALASCEVPEKLLGLLRHLADRHGVPTQEGLEIPVRLTQHELAALIGSCREAVSRGLKALRARGLISVNSRYITLRQPA
ncbi:MAG: Crp/Fnr family transcriptional regulator [Armatimonadetes bacterium]|nr:Crp/Fnr family transcriptional regulator [Armatimonadota bacterium]